MKQKIDRKGKKRGWRKRGDGKEGGRGGKEGGR